MSDADSQSQQDLSLPQPQSPAPDQTGASSSNDPQSPAPVQPIQPPVNPAAQTPATAEDSDLIEKEWVEKAKDIVDKTRDDPYQQNKALSQMKADYIKKRYNKDLKLDND